MIAYDRLKPLLRTGDIALFSGRRLPYRAIEAATHSEWSHVEALFEAFGHFFSVGAVGTGVRVTRLGQRLIEHQGRARILRPKWQDDYQYEPAQNIRFIQAVLNLEGSPYDWPGAAAFLVRKLFPAFQWQEPNRKFCSELIAEGLEMAGFPWTHLMPSEVLPASFDDNEHFFEVGLIPNESAQGG